MAMALEHKEFKNPPIKEAIFAISFKETIPQDKLILFAESNYVKENFPIFQQGVRVEVSNKPTKDPKQLISTTEKHEGFLVRSGTGKERNAIINVNPTMLSYHNSNKYAGWDNMYAELRTIWKEFCTSSGKSVVSQISVRYLNHISLPFPFPSKGGFSDYIKLMPQIPEGINNSVDSFFIQINIANDEGDLKGIITETILPTNDINILNLLLDLSVVKQNDFDCEKEEMWDTFVKIRGYKNKIFLSCITEETEKLFN